jgi:hypothetical protein
LVIIGALCLLATALPATAQIQVMAQTKRSNFLLYERVDLYITITNIGGTDLVLNNDDKDHPWLSFLLSRHTGPNYLPIRQERNSEFNPISLKAGENKTLRVNVTPLFAFREEGDYRVAAVVDLPGAGQAFSDNVGFTVFKGQTVWSQVHPVDGSERTYSLVRFSPDSDSTKLFLRVEDPAENLVYANVGLGEMVSSIDPSVFFDPQGNVHILHPSALGTYVYTRADPDGKIVHQGVFKTEAMRTESGIERIPPRLTKLDDGNVIVLGGMQEDPNAPREKLSDGQVLKTATAPTPASTTAPTNAKQ